MSLSCFDCYAFRLNGERACWKHMNAVERADMDRRILAWADRPHPLLDRMLRK